MARCKTPYAARDKDNVGTFPVPCGKCPNCVARKVSEWSFRLQWELKRSKTPTFVTLTYKNENVPLSNNGYMTLKKRDVQLFFKRLRNYSPQNKIKYYAAGEYGTKTKRPHYHIILFNADPAYIKVAWGLGSVDIGTVTPASIGYNLKYISKKVNRKKHSRDDRVPEFSLMSKGLGSNYLDETIIKWHEADMYNRMYVVGEGGRKLPMARYYKDRIYTKEQREHIGAKYATKIEETEKEKRRTYDGDYDRDEIERDKAAYARKLYLAGKTEKL